MTRSVAVKRAKTSKPENEENDEEDCQSRDEKHSDDIHTAGLPSATGEQASFLENATSK